jgi:hypothetical protein
MELFGVQMAGKPVGYDEYWASPNPQQLKWRGFTAEELKDPGTRLLANPLLDGADTLPIPLHWMMMMIIITITIVCM